MFHSYISTVSYLGVIDYGVIFVDTLENEPSNIRSDGNVYDIICTRVFVVFFIVSETLFKIMLKIERLNGVKVIDTMLMQCYCNDTRAVPYVFFFVILLINLQMIGSIFLIEYIMPDGPLLFVLSIMVL